MNLINVENMFMKIFCCCVITDFYLGGAVTQCQPTGRSVVQFLVTPVCMAKCL